MRRQTRSAQVAIVLGTRGLTGQVAVDVARSHRNAQPRTGRAIARTGTATNTTASVAYHQTSFLLTRYSDSPVGGTTVGWASYLRATGAAGHGWQPVQLEGRSTHALGTDR